MGKNENGLLYVFFKLLVVLLFLFPLKYSLSSSCFNRYYQQLQSSTNIFQYPLNQCVRIHSVYILYILALFITLCWSYAMTVSCQ